ncbi:TRAP transporter large permease [Thalassovita taeanensis]|uniref:TRAP transporter large permease protein n=1 Tax=Thalassovita taeanensis TaxID=657014 RepID=A0A1H9H7D9_9RHOB|nr:TRAP transporter large permease subunit [Thalassovita taeanensis]SEQ58226.1 TRAP transporter, DctM subunit [Thalassovita taeanensis]
MDPFTSTAIAVAALFFLLAVRMPIALALALLSCIGIAILRSPRAAWSSMASIPYDFAAHWSLSAIPMFLLMGALAHRGGLTSTLFEAAKIWLSRLPGGLAVATNVATAMFASASGSSIATTAAMSRLAAPEMLRAGYSPSLATSVIAASGTIGALIPPSIAFVIYGWYTEQPIGELLIAGIIPGLLTALCYIAIIIGRVLLNPEIAPRVDTRYSWREKFAVLGKIWPVPLLILTVIGSIFTGFATATESAALGSIATLLLCLLRGTLNFSVIRDSLLDALKSSATIFFIALGAALFTKFIAITGLPAEVGTLIVELDPDPLVIILIMIGMYLVLGMFLDPIGIMLITLPILLPVFTALDMNLIWVGVLVVKMIEIGLLTPPVGLNVFVVKSVLGDQIALMDIFKGVTWFLLAEVVIMALLITFPELSVNRRVKRCQIAA